MINFFDLNIRKLRLVLLAACVISTSVCWTNDTYTPQKDGGGLQAVDDQTSKNPRVPAPTPTISHEYKEALGDIWIDKDKYTENGISIVRTCSGEKPDDYIGSCNLSLRSGRKLHTTFSVEHGRKLWLKYGFTNLLNNNSRQLIVFTYSGGAHCCYDYVIYDLQPKLRVIYDSNKFDSANDIGNELVPVDIDGDGIFEFYQDVMAFDYMGAAGHAGASFPPAVFAYDEKVGKYVPATKRFPGLVRKQLDDLLAGIESTSDTDVETLNEFRVRTKFLFLVYAGQRDAAWDYFEQNYRSTSGNGYQEQFKEQFKREFVEIFAKDPTYISIYGRQ